MLPGEERKPRALFCSLTPYRHTHPLGTRRIPRSCSPSKELSGPIQEPQLYKATPSISMARCGHPGWEVGTTRVGRHTAAVGCSKGRAPQGHAVSRRLSKPLGERASVSAGHPHARPPELPGKISTVHREDGSPEPHPPAPVTHSAFCACSPCSAVRAGAGRHLHLGNSALGHSLQRAVESQSGSQRLLASKGQLPKLR